jgi:prepilin-type N-terminal cleavage/methylation domain-containing protein/prepilin-type processing-associated H-X9-DG protein
MNRQLSTSRGSLTVTSTLSATGGTTRRPGPLVSAWAMRSQTSGTHSIHRPYAFTLLEVLVVVAIIALLAALLVPSLSAAQRSAKRVACQANLRQLAVGWHSYLHDSKERFLRGTTANFLFGGKQGTYLIPYTKGPVSKPLNKYMSVPLITYGGAEAFHCPADPGGDAGSLGSTSRSGPGEVAVRACYFDYYGTSYRTNRILIGPLDLPTSPLEPCQGLMAEINRRLPSLTRSQIKNESKLLLMGDAGWDQAWNVATIGSVEWHGRPRTHNIAFMDGHVQFLEIPKGQHVTRDYTVIPFSDLLDAAGTCQKNR